MPSPSPAPPRRRLAGLVPFLAALASAPPAPAQQAPVVLAPHRAIYDLSLATARSSSGIAELSGRMVYELTGSQCEGWTQNMRFVTRMQNAGGSTLTDLRSSSFEDGPAKRFRFSSSQYRDEKQSEATAGDATRKGDVNDPAGVAVDLERPAREKVNLPGNVYFPIQHSIAMIEAARAGKTLFKADLYDGSEKGQKVYLTTAVIGRGTGNVNASLPAAKNTEKLNGVPAWPVTISYYDKGSEKKDATPTYELGFVFFENGVSRKLLIDYGDFAIRGEISELTFLDAAPCEAKR